MRRLLLVLAMLAVDVLVLPPAVGAHIGNPDRCASGDTLSGQFIDTNKDGTIDLIIWTCDETLANGTPGTDGVADSVHFDLDLDGQLDTPPENNIVCFRGVRVRVFGEQSGQGLRVFVEHCSFAVGRSVRSAYVILDADGDGNTVDEVRVVYDGIPAGRP